MGTSSRTIAFSIVVIVLAAAFILGAPTLISRAQEAVFAQGSNQATIQPDSQPLDLEEAADKAENLSQAVYQGAETTKKLVGKTEARNEAIEHGRTVASDKLENLAERARQVHMQPEVSDSDELLSETDKKTLKHITQ